jgi:hypothetical protein
MSRSPLYVAAEWSADGYWAKRFVQSWRRGIHGVLNTSIGGGGGGVEHQESGVVCLIFSIGAGFGDCGVRRGAASIRV